MEIKTEAVELFEHRLKKQYPDANIELVRVFAKLVEIAIIYREVSGRYLPLFGELGEIFAEIAFGIKRHKPGTQGSDGKLGNDFVEIKTISPEKKTEATVVKRKGNFSKLLLVKISKDFEFEARMKDRKEMTKGSGKLARISWSSLESSET